MPRPENCPVRPLSHYSRRKVGRFHEKSVENSTPKESGRNVRLMKPRSLPKVAKKRPKEPKFKVIVIVEGRCAAISRKNLKREASRSQDRCQKWRKSEAEKAKELKEKEAVEPVFVNRSMEPAISRKNEQDCILVVRLKRQPRIRTVEFAK